LKEGKSEGGKKERKKERNKEGNAMPFNVTECIMLSTQFGADLSPLHLVVTHCVESKQTWNVHEFAHKMN
jgi:hypothetical protein